MIGINEVWVVIMLNIFWISGLAWVIGRALKSLLEVHEKYIEIKHKK